MLQIVLELLYIFRWSCDIDIHIMFLYCSDYIITVTDVMNAIAHLKSGQSDGSESLFSDHFIHDTQRFYVILSILFTSMLSHRFSSNSMILGTMIPIPKDKKKSLCNSGNYRAIALCSIFSKILDWVILSKEKMTLCSFILQFGFKKGTSTTQCTFRMLETIDHYNFMKSNVLYCIVLYCIMRPYTDGPIGPLSYKHSSGVVRNPHSTLAK